MADHRPAVWTGQELPVGGCHRGGDRAVRDHRLDAVDIGHALRYRRRDPGPLRQQEGLDGRVAPTERHRDLWFAATTTGTAAYRWTGAADRMPLSIRIPQAVTSATAKLSATNAPTKPCRARPHRLQRQPEHQAASFAPVSAVIRSATASAVGRCN